MSLLPDDVPRGIEVNSAEKEPNPGRGFNLKNAIHREAKIFKKAADFLVENPDPQWTSVPLDLPSDPLPDDLPPLPGLARSSAAIREAQARAAELAAQAAKVEEDLAAAFKAADGDRVLALRREHEEAHVKLWAAQTEAAKAHMAHFEAEEFRIMQFLTIYGRPLDDLRTTIRALREQEVPLAKAVGYVEGLIETCRSQAERAERALGRLALGPDRPPSREGWEPAPAVAVAADVEGGRSW
jgi:hypothetical protein